MPGINTIEQGNTALTQIMRIALTPAAVGANTTAEQTFTVNGVQLNDFVVVNKPTTQAGIGIVGARASAANQVAITFSNNTGGGITPTAGELYLIVVMRADASNLPNFPSSIS